MTKTSFFLKAYDVRKNESSRTIGDENAYVQVLLENDTERSLYGKKYNTHGNWFGNKISFSDTHCYYVYNSNLYRCKMSKLPFKLYARDDLQSGENGYYNEITKWDNDQ
jgi:hypothetical protein